jgi:hypothetical protein
MKTKYIIVRLHQIDKLVAVLFPDAYGLSHRDVARLHSASERAVVGAGFCEIDYQLKKVDVYGKSDTLEKQSKPEDAVTIAELFG